MTRRNQNVGSTRGRQAAVLGIFTSLGAATLGMVACSDLAQLGTPKGVGEAGVDATPPSNQDPDATPPSNPDAGPDALPDAGGTPSSPDAGIDAAPTPRGGLDPTFGAGTGTVLLGGVAPAYLGVHSLAIQPDGAIVYGGEYMTSTQWVYALLVGRTTPSGAVDTTFNVTGRFTAEQNGYWDEVGGSVALLPGGGIVVDGFIDPNTDPNHEMFAVRLTSAGQPDPTFGGGTGFVAVADGNVDAKANSVLLQSDGKLLLGGFQGPQAGIVRLAADGSLDPTFGTPSDSGATGATEYPGLGMITQLVSSSTGGFFAAVQASGFVVVGMKADGTIDSRYGSSGQVTVTLPAPLTSGPDMIAAPDGSVVCVGSTATTLELVRLTPAGALDPTFGQGGRTSVPTSLTAAGIARLPDGSFAVGVTNPSTNFGVVRLSAAGVLDTDFGHAGFATVPVPTNSSASVVVDASGRIVVGTGTDKGVVLARFAP